MRAWREGEGDQAKNESQCWVLHLNNEITGASCGNATASLLLVADREAFADVCWVLEFIHESDGVVLERNAAVAVGVSDELVFAEAEFAGAFTWFEETGGAEVGPRNV